MLLSGRVFLRESRWSLLSLEADYVQVSHSPFLRIFVPILITVLLYFFMQVNSKFPRNSVLHSSTEE